MISEEKKKVLIASTYYKAVENSKGEHSFMLEKKFRDNLSEKDSAIFNIPKYICNAIEFILED